MSSDVDDQPALAAGLVRRIVQAFHNEQSGTKKKQPAVLTPKQMRALDDLCEDVIDATALMIATETVLHNENTHMNSRYDEQLRELVTERCVLIEAAARERHELENPDLSDVVDNVLQPIRARLQLENRIQSTDEETT